MSTLTFTKHGVGTTVHAVDEDGALQQPSRYPARKAVIVVRNQKEYDYLHGMMLVTGKELQVYLDGRDKPKEDTPPTWVSIPHLTD